MPAVPAAFHIGHNTSALLGVDNHNPTYATLRREAFAQSYLSLPRGKQPVTLGTGFSTVAAATANINPFREAESAFDLKELEDTDIAFHRSDSASGLFLSNTSTKLSSGSDHLSLNLGVGIGNDFVGASVTGSYDKSVLSNSNSSRTSRRASYEAGSLHFPRTPSLSVEAIRLLDDHGYGAFVQRYGDFYITAFTIGGDAGIMISESYSSDSSSEQEKITSEGHFLGISDEEVLAEIYDSDARNASEFTLTAFDSLTNTFIDLPKQSDRAMDDFVSEQGLATPLMPIARFTNNGYRELSTTDARNVALDFDVRVQQLPQRVRKQLAQLSQIDPQTTRIGWDDLRMLQQSGLVFRMILVPFASHRGVRPYAAKASTQ